MAVYLRSVQPISFEIKLNLMNFKQDWLDRSQIHEYAP